MYELIAHQKLESTASAITFSNIPQSYTDLYVLVSVRSTNSDDGLFFKFNNTTSNTSWRNLLGYGSGVLTQTGSGWLAGGGVRSATASTFTNISVYIPNYTSSVAKTASVDSTSEENGSTAYQFLVANLWNDTAAINRIDFYLQTAQLAAGSSATLYGVNRTQVLGKPKAIGGAITYSNGYWVHTFTGSGTFSTAQSLNVDALVVAGGGGGGYDWSGGGGAGGFRTTSTLVTSGSYPIVVGAGGAGGPNVNTRAFNGGDSSFLSVTSLGGGGGGSDNEPTGDQGAAGGSGGGGAIDGAGGSGTSGQGNAGASGNRSNYLQGGGGGGAGAAASAQQGGPGLPWNGAYYAGGGGGAVNTNASGGRGLGGIGGGGQGSVSYPNGGATAGTANTGGGGGASTANSPAPQPGGSGVVIIRYKAD